MKYMCEICGCTLTDQKKMAEHETQCLANHKSLIYCAEDINRLVGLANAVPFIIVAEIPCALQQGSNNVEAESYIKTEFKYYPIISAEYDGKKNRCVLKVKDDEIKNAADSKTQPKKK